MQRPGTLRRVLLVSFALLLSAGVAFGQSAPSLVVIVTSEPSSAPARRLAKDLQSLGLDVLVLKATPENSSGRASLELSARSVGAIAAVRLVPAGEGTEVWVADRITGKTVIRDLVGSSPETGPDDVALGAVELLRASLMELHSPTPHTGDAELTTAVRDLAFPVPVQPAVAKMAPVFSLMGGPAVDLGIRSAGPSLAASWGAWARVAPNFGARGFVSLPIVPERTSVVEGTIQVSSAVMGVGVSFDIRRDALFSPYIAGGPALARIATVGFGRTPFISASQAAWYGGAYAELGAALALSQGLRLYADCMGVLLASAPAIKAGGRTIGRWGAPGVIASIGVEVSVLR